jgi:hypothetical protein
MVSDPVVSNSRSRFVVTLYHDLLSLVVYKEPETPNFQTPLAVADKASWRIK